MRPIPEITRLGKTLRRWKTARLTSFSTGAASNSGTEALDGILEIGRRIARGFRNVEHYRVRMLLTPADSTPHPHAQL